MTDMARVEAVIEGYMRYLELGGAPPSLDHLSPAEQHEAKQAIDLLRATRRMRLDSGRSEDLAFGDTGQLEAPRFPEEPDPVAQEVISELRNSLPATVTIATDLAVADRLYVLDAPPILGAWTVGTFGGRVRVWFVDAATGSDLEQERNLLRRLDRAFRMLLDTAAIALVARDGTCLLVGPEDCAPSLDAPRGTISSRRFRRPIQPASAAVAIFLNELTPPWDPIPTFGVGAIETTDYAAITSQAASHAIRELVATGSRARQPRKAALTALGDVETSTIARTAVEVLEGTIDPTAARSALERLARRR